MCGDCVSKYRSGAQLSTIAFKEAKAVPGMFATALSCGTEYHGLYTTVYPEKYVCVCKRVVFAREKYDKRFEDIIKASLQFAQLAAKYGLSDTEKFMRRWLQIPLR